MFKIKYTRKETLTDEEKFQQWRAYPELLVGQVFQYTKENSDKGNTYRIFRYKSGYYTRSFQNIHHKENDNTVLRLEDIIISLQKKELKHLNNYYPNI